MKAKYLLLTSCLLLVGCSTTNVNNSEWGCSSLQSACQSVRFVNPLCCETPCNSCCCTDPACCLCNPCLSHARCCKYFGNIGAAFTNEHDPC